MSSSPKITIRSADFKVYYRLTLTCIIVAKHEELVIGTERGQKQAFELTY